MEKNQGTAQSLTKTDADMQNGEGKGAGTDLASDKKLMRSGTKNLGKFF